MKIFTELPLIGKYVKQIDDDVQSYGFPKAMGNILARSKSKIVIEGMNEETEHILRTRQVIIVANHPTDTSVLALISVLPERKDIYVIMNRRFTGMSQNIDTHIIPVYVDHHVQSKVLVKIFGSLYRKLNPKPAFTAEEEHKKNIQSICNGARRVNEGGLIAVFPGFPETRGIEGSWFNGIGYLLKQIEKRDICIMRVYIHEHALMGYLRIIPFVGLLLPCVIIRFAEPLTLSDVYDENPKEIRRKLEKEYASWVHTSTSLI